MQGRITILAATLVCSAACSDDFDRKADIVYQVNGSAAAVSVHYTNESGGLEGLETGVPWSHEMRVNLTESLLLTASNRDDESRVVTCAILKEGRILQDARSEGLHANVTCSASPTD